MQLIQVLTSRGTQLVMFGVDNSGRNWYTWRGHFGTQLIQFLDCGTQLVLPQLYLYASMTCRLFNHLLSKWIRCDWIHLAQHRGQWRAVLNTRINLFPNFLRIVFLAEKLLVNSPLSVFVTDLLRFVTYAFHSVMCQWIGLKTNSGIHDTDPV